MEHQHSRNKKHRQRTVVSLIDFTKKDVFELEAAESGK
jgi:hypothetical protein